jgi:hypothetical protein
MKGDTTGVNRTRSLLISGSMRANAARIYVLGPSSFCTMLLLVDSRQR